MDRPGTRGQDERRAHVGWAQHPLAETIVSYLLVLIGAAVMLWTFGRRDDPLFNALDLSTNGRVPCRGRFESWRFIDR